MLMSLHLSIISWMLLKYPEECSLFMTQLETTTLNGNTPFQANNGNVDIPSAAGRVLDVWLEKMPLATQSDRKKLLAMGLSSLLTNGSQVVADRIYALLQNVAETLYDIMKYEEESKTYIE